MTFFKTLGLMAMTCGLLLGQAPAEDPVMKARAQRAQAHGVNEGDLPPLPKGITEPPPLPPPELHVRDMARTSRSTRVAERRAGRRGKHVRGKVVRGKASRGKAVATKAAPKAVKPTKKRRRR